MNKNDKIFVAGHAGMVGSAIIRNLKKRNFLNIVTVSHKELDLRNQQSVSDFFMNNSFDYVIIAAAKVGGIHANNTYPAEFIYNNLMIEANIINSSYESNVSRLLFLDLFPMTQTYL